MSLLRFSLPVFQAIGLLLVGMSAWSGRGEVAPEADFYTQARTAAAALQQWYDPQGRWNQCGWWNAANCLEALESVAEAGNGREYLAVIEATFERNKEGGFLNEFYDDEGWWALAWIRAFDLTGQAKYLAMAKSIFADMQGGWDEHCGGGCWWKKDRHYKNAIANELFLLVAIRLHQRTPGDRGPASYLEWARREWTWFKQSGMINEQHLVNDGLTMDCQNNRRTTWTYNQGVLIGGLVEWYRSTGDTNALAEAAAIADRATGTLVDAGVLCEPNEWRGLNGQDAPQFKGIFARHLAELYGVTRKPEYRAFLLSNARSVWLRNRDEQNRFGGRWSGPLDDVDPVRQTSALRLLAALAAPVTTNLVFIKPADNPVFRHATGLAAGIGRWKCRATDPSGYAVVGPPVASLAAGVHVLHCRLSVGSVSNQGLTLARLEARGTNPGAAPVTRAIAWNEFSRAHSPRDFSLAFTNLTENSPVQFQLYWHGAPGGPDLTVSDWSVDGVANWSAAGLEHDLGQPDEFGHWCAEPNRQCRAGFLTRGPGVAKLPAGDYEIGFELKVDNFNCDDSVVATISVADAESNRVLSARDLRRGEFGNTLFHTFVLRAAVVPGQRLDFRTYWHGGAAAPRLTQRAVFIRPVRPVTRTCNGF